MLNSRLDWPEQISTLPKCTSRALSFEAPLLRVSVWGPEGATASSRDQPPSAPATALAQGVVAPTQRLTLAPAAASPQTLACFGPAALLCSLRQQGPGPGSASQQAAAGGQQ